MGAAVARPSPVLEVAQRYRQADEADRERQAEDRPGVADDAQHLESDVDVDDRPQRGQDLPVEQLVPRADDGEDDAPDEEAAGRTPMVGLRTGSSPIQGASSRQGVSSSIVILH